MFKIATRRHDTSVPTLTTRNKAHQEHPRSMTDDLRRLVACGGVLERYPSEPYAARGRSAQSCPASAVCGRALDMRFRTQRCQRCWKTSADTVSIRSLARASLAVPCSDMMRFFCPSATFARDRRRFILVFVYCVDHVGLNTRPDMRFFSSHMLRPS